METLSPEALDRVPAQRRYHAIELAPGVVTDGWFDFSVPHVVLRAFR